jgi:hypothetical protein
MDFEFKPELFEYRQQIIEVLAAADFWWLSSFRSIDIDHQEFALEIDGVQTEDVARGIVDVLSAKFKWAFYVFCRDYDDEDWFIRIDPLHSGVVFVGRDDGRYPGLSSFKFYESPKEGCRAYC